MKESPLVPFLGMGNGGRRKRSSWKKEIPPFPSLVVGGAGREEMGSDS